MAAVSMNLCRKNSPKNGEIWLLFWGGYYYIFIQTFYEFRPDFFFQTALGLAVVICLHF